ncbi:Dyp-type peroxidase [Iodobacter arcticus]|uniref:Dyp-type peroxidase n=1 Tax=Iodobacter arcticus TaxID=590593 RepID=A0ABW2QXM1_9NEIS
MVASKIDFSDVQGTLLRGYRVNFARHFILSITNAKEAAQLIGMLVDGRDGLPKISTAEQQYPKPPYFFNLSFTYTGLASIGLKPAQLASFGSAIGPSFKRGAAHCDVAKNVGDIGSSAPEHWIIGLDKQASIHIVLSLWVTDSLSVLESVSAQLRAAFAGCMNELYVHDATALPDNKVHFGYRDCIAQPTIEGAPQRKYPMPDQQPVVATGELLLGYQNALGGYYTKTAPPELALNSSFAAFRILEQDVAGFEALLTELSNKAKLDREKIAAKICGRWRNGNPLVLAPDEAGTVLHNSELNDFTYVIPDSSSDDTLGLKCPIGSHIRRNNPRNEKVIGDDVESHRIVRRAMPYGPEYDPAQPDTRPRGLVGYFINASIENQFEFITSQWNDQSSFVKSAEVKGAGNALYNISGQDVFLGVNDPAESSFTLPIKTNQKPDNVTFTGFSRCITTRLGIYCFFPSIKGLRYLAGLTGPIS